MTLFEFAVTYAVSWWLVLFMVLPHGAEPEVSPGAGHAPSAPAKPKLGKKAKLTTLIAIIPAVALYFIVGAAKAEDSIYHAGRGSSADCRHPVAHSPSADVAMKDGTGAGGAEVKGATMDNGPNILSTHDKAGYDIPLNLPSQKYVADAAGKPRNADLSESFISAGKLHVSPDGKTTLDGQPIAGGAPECADGAQ